MAKIITSSYGYPKIGQNRELKKTLESYWAGKISKEVFLKETQSLNGARLQKQKEAWVDLIASNDFSLYDFVLDTAVSLGIIPERFSYAQDELDRYFAMARGNDGAA
ncbi:MAG: 5-methyltetrahydropteroyltriglutamate--homocysteine S-methyltransferase, partial [Endomicrobium sp.]|nr:5-methyltetrahydropteroyltriglutamate--homocysteine S-methyltransferase [Endomicrobium sp.]